MREKVENIDSCEDLSIKRNILIQADMINHYVKYHGIVDKFIALVKVNYMNYSFRILPASWRIDHNIDAMIKVAYPKAKVGNFIALYVVPGIKIKFLENKIIGNYYLS